MKNSLIFIRKHIEYDIYFDPIIGEFCTPMDTKMVGDSLKSLMKRMETLADKIQAAKRTEIPGVPLVVFSQQNNGSYKIWKGTVHGVVAGQIYRKKLRTSMGQIDISPTIICAHPSDTRVKDIATICEKELQLRKQLQETMVSLENILNTCAHVSIPECQTKLDALEKEPIFLETLRSIQPVKGE